MLNMPPYAVLAVLLKLFDFILWLWKWRHKHSRLRRSVISMKIPDATKMPLDHSPNLLQMLGMTRKLFTEHMLHQLCLMRRMTLSFKFRRPRLSNFAIIITYPALRPTL
jgi:hypothetical protein